MEEKEGWILRKKSELEKADIRLPPEDLDGYEFSLLGKACKIRLCEGNRIGFDSEKNELYLPRKNARERIRKWLKENAERILSRVTAQKAKEMQTSYRSVSVTAAKTRWGSCSYDNSLHYSFRILYAPKEIIEYVVTHELAHTKHKNHSKAFWREVEKYEPAWKQKRKWLKEHGRFMEIF